ncbi:MAG: methionyl-tRNA formyltransferase [Acidobacteria bacterium]|nr:methionyl-tRNA formyltransferase [Acidobacteriota bacterium]
MRVVFFGTPDVASVALRALLERHEVVAVVTQPDRPAGRARAPLPGPVKTLAAQSGLPVLQPGSPRDPGFAEALAAHRPEALAIVAYGHILPVEVLEVAPAVNVHFSLLPRYRGAAPVQRALMDGVTETGVTTFLLEPTVDTGPILMQEPVRIDPEETAGDLLARLAPLGARMLVESLDAVSSGAGTGSSQDPALASPAPKIKPEEALINWSWPAERIANLVRALNPSPVAWTMFRGRRLNLWRARSLEGAGEGAGDPGRVLGGVSSGFAVSAGSGAVWPLELQPEGKRRMSVEEFVRGYRPAPTDRLGPGEPSGT